MSLPQFMDNGILGWRGIAAQCEVTFGPLLIIQAFPVICQSPKVRFESLADCEALVYPEEGRHERTVEVIIGRKHHAEREVVEVLHVYEVRWLPVDYSKSSGDNERE